MALHITRFTRASSRGQWSPISILSLLSEEDWSKLTRLQIGDGLLSYLPFFWAFKVRLLIAGIGFMVCQKLDELEGDFLQARAESQHVDSLGWTDREFLCLRAILDHKREGHQGERCPGD
jgi:hypothetical protein